METAHSIIIYAWIGIAVIMLPTAAILFLVSWLVAHIGNTLWGNLAAIYRLECIKHYFQKMEKEGTHAFRPKPEDKT